MQKNAATIPADIIGAGPGLRSVGLLEDDVGAEFAVGSDYFDILKDSQVVRARPFCDHLEKILLECPV